MREPNRATVDGSVASWPGLVTSGPPGIVGYAAGHHSTAPRWATGRRWYHAGLLVAERVKTDVRDSGGVGQSIINPERSQKKSSDNIARNGIQPFRKTSRSIRLGELAHTRSGDKGNRSNIGVVANDRASYDLAGKPVLTESVVADFLRPMGIGPVRRYELPCAPRFQLCDRACLGGWTSHSLRLDTQGKAVGAVLLELMLPGPGLGSRHVGKGLDPNECEIWSSESIVGPVDPAHP